MKKICQKIVSEFSMNFWNIFIFAMGGGGGGGIKNLTVFHPVSTTSPGELKNDNSLRCFL